MTDVPAQSAAEVFDALRQEVALLRMTVQELLNERQTPDYSQTLGKIMRDMNEASKGVTLLVNSPAIQTPAAELAKQISAAGNQARQQDQETIRDAARALGQATAEIDGQVARFRIASEQKRWLWHVGLSAIGGGAILGVVIAIGLLHMAPEHGAAWILGLNRWNAGEQLLASANPDKWRALRYATEIDRESYQAIADCQGNVKRTGRNQYCRIFLRAPFKPDR